MRLFRHPNFLPAAAVLLSVASLPSLASLPPPPRQIHIPAPADPSADAAPLIRRAIENAPAGEPLRITLDAATYRVSAEKAAEVFTFVSNHDSGLKRAAFMLRGRRDIEIDGRGATLLLSGQAMMAFEIGDCENVTIRNLAIDWNRALNFQARVIAVDETADSVDIAALPECNARVQDGQLVFGEGGGDTPNRVPWQCQVSRAWWQNLAWTHWVDAATGRALPAPAQQQFSAWNAKLGRPAQAQKIGDANDTTAANTFRLTHAFPRLPAVGAVLVAKGTLMPNRLSPAIHIARSSGVLVENVTVHHAGGMGLIAESSRDITLRRFQVRLPENSPRLVSTTADATHFVQCAGSILVEDCLLENMLDDGINVHGVHAIVDALLAPDRIGVRISHFQQLGLDYAAPGDRIRLISHDTLLPYAERTVKEIHPVNAAYIEIVFTEPVDAALRPGSIMDNATRQPDLTFRRNTIRNNRARSVLVTTAGHVLIEENHFENPSASVILIEGDGFVWYESGAVTDVLIRNNDITATSPAPVFAISSKQTKTNDTPQPPYHRNIRIEDNRITTTTGRLLETYRVDGLRFTGNKIQAPPGLAKPDTTQDAPRKTPKSPRKTAATAVPGFIFHDTTTITIQNNQNTLPWRTSIISRTTGKPETQTDWK